jgi:hypothetical protein
LEETSVGKCVYRFRSDPSIKVAALAEEIYQMMKAKAQEGTERRIRHKSAGIEDGAQIAVFDATIEFKLSMKFLSHLFVYVVIASKLE